MTFLVQNTRKVPGKNAIWSKHFVTLFRLRNDVMSGKCRIVRNGKIVASKSDRNCDWNSWTFATFGVSQKRNEKTIFETIRSNSGKKVCVPFWIHNVINIFDVRCVYSCVSYVYKSYTVDSVMKAYILKILHICDEPLVQETNFSRQQLLSRLVET